MLAVVPLWSVSLASGRQFYRGDTDSTFDVIFGVSRIFEFSQKSYAKVFFVKNVNDRQILGGLVARLFQMNPNNDNGTKSRTDKNSHFTSRQSGTRANNQMLKQKLELRLFRDLNKSVC